MAGKLLSLGEDAAKRPRAKLEKLLAPLSVMLKVMGVRMPTNPIAMSKLRRKTMSVRFVGLTCRLKLVVKSTYLIFRRGLDGAVM